MCPNGLENINASCRFHRAIDNLPEDNLCPLCQEELVLATHPEDQITKTIIGEEHIEEEIVHIKARKHEGKSHPFDPDFTNKSKEEQYREKRREDIRKAIEAAREHEHK